MGNFVFADCASMVTWNGRSLMLHPGQPWYADDPFVLARPEFFVDEPPNACSTVPEHERKERQAKAPKLATQHIEAWLKSLSKEQKQALGVKLLESAK